MGKKAKSKGRNPRKINSRAPVSSPRAAAAEGADPASEAAGQGEEATGVCKHYKKGDAQMNRLLLRIHSSLGADGKCEDCREEPGTKKVGKAKGKNVRKRGVAASEEAKLGSGTIWVCLDCNHLACGGGVSESEPYGHARRHAKQGRHSLAVRLDNPLVGWCFPCNSSIPIEMPEVQNGEPSQVADIEDVWFGENGESGRTANTTEALALEHKRGYTVRGLMNLGNTCFFNSVMQNLLAMGRLRSYFLSLDQPVGPLTTALKKLFVETGGGSEIDYKSRITPSNLFGCVCSKAPQFRGYQQQDSHELLRYLLDGLCMEESSTRKLLANPHKDKPASESDKDSKASDSVNTFVEAIFGGQLSSTVRCIECGHSSIVYEPFLDLSLPIPRKKAPSKHVPVALPKRSKLPLREASAGRGRKIRERRGNRGIPTLEKAESASSPSESNVPFCNAKPEPEPEPELVTAPTLGDDSWWIDYVEPAQVLDNTNQVYQSSGTSAIYGPENEGENLEYSSELQSDALPREQIGPPEYPAGDFCEDKDLPQIQHSEIILLPYKKLDSSAEEMTGSTLESQHPADMDLGDTAANELNDRTLSSVEYGQTEPDFDGFGDLFNEPETAPDTKMETSICEDLGTPWLGGNSSESNQDEVDDTNAPVSIDRCLACFTMPELLSDEHAWHCENCSKILQCQNEENKRGRPPFIQDNGSKDLMSLYNRGKFVDQGSVSSFDARVSEDAVFTALDNGKLMTADVNYQHNITKVDKDEYLTESEHTSQYLSCSSTPGRPISQASSSNEENDLSSRDEFADAASDARSLGAAPSCSPECTETLLASSSENNNLNEAVQVKGPNLSGTTQSVDDSEEEKMGSQHRKIKRDATKRILINKVPYILTIHLKRFSQDARGRLSKLNGHVSFPETLDLRPYMDSRCKDNGSFSYHLVGVVEHSGSMRGGHYIAYVRGEKNLGKTQKDVSSWFYASDAHVREVSLHEVLQSEAYILFYERV
uniref:Ubiquitin carboxyl-terminal hydrolase n=1 Tax=Anthurium amnicola TaxID=1678845 RepID=A0A1D1XLJ2_9ARAE